MDFVREGRSRRVGPARTLRRMLTPSSMLLASSIRETTAWCASHVRYPGPLRTVSQLRHAVEDLDRSRACLGPVGRGKLRDHVISAADSISGARPGARRETLENYIRRLEKLERIADGFDGVEKSYAIQAGREIRILVSYKKIDDAQSIQLASDISRRIEDEMEYPGQIKVVVIRETRAIDFAK